MVKRYVAIPGSERAPLPGARVIGRPNPRRVMGVTVLLRSRAAEGLAAVDEMAARLPHERQYLSREDFAAAHGADPEDIAKIRRFARQHRLVVVSQDAAARTVELRGSVAALSQAFQVRLLRYRHPRGIYRGRTGPVQVPAELHGIVQGVFGLDNRLQARPHFRRAIEPGGAWAHAAGLSYTPVQVAKLYNFPPGNGQGQCIAIIELGGGYRMKDLNNYFQQQLGIPTPAVSAVSVLGGSNSPSNPNSADGEVMLDIEVAGAVAPGAKIVVYFAPNTTRGFLRAINRAIHDIAHKPSVISISWGMAEKGWTQQSLQAFDNAFKAAAALGISVCCASGDGGSSDGVHDGKAHVDFPASSTYALGCGGTTLTAAGNAIASEVVWNDLPSDGATGGGISDFFPLPSWQNGAHVPHSVNPGGHVGRGVPDIAGDADPATGYKVRVDGQNMVIGGTSAVAPLWAGLIALLNQSLGQPVGYLNPVLGHVASVAGTRDITQGSNPAYHAGAGWDACTGWGSPNGAAILAALQGGGEKKAKGGEEEKT
jgi:kumamolisin